MAPLPVKYSRKKDGHRMRWLIFHVTWLPPPEFPGSATDATLPLYYPFLPPRPVVLVKFVRTKFSLA